MTRASKAIDSLPLAEVDADVVQVLRDLHPERDPPNIPEPTAPPLQINKDLLRSVLQNAPKGSAPGPDGWTYEHVRDAIQAAPEAETAAVEFLNIILQGSLPYLDTLLDSRLIALTKPGAGLKIRPIAIGEAWLRLASLCAMAACSDVGPSLAPLQLGVKVRGGSQCIGHALKAGIEADPDCVTIQLDWRNAFNTLSREAMLQAVQQRAPSLLAYVTWCYGQPTRLHVENAPPNVPPLLSQAGVRQGDPLGPLLFALTLQQALEEVRDGSNPARVIAFADDTFLQGASDACIQSFVSLLDNGADIGLEASLGKCGVYSPNSQAAANVADTLGISHQLHGLVVAGTPFGSDAFVREHVKTKADNLDAVIEKLVGLPLPTQDATAILRTSLQLRLSHLTRCVEWNNLETALRGTEDKVEEAMLEILRLHDIDASAKEQLSLPLRFGGMALQKTVKPAANAAFIAAAAVTEIALEDAAPELLPFANASGDRLRQQWQELHNGCPDVWEAADAVVDERCIRAVLPQAQRKFNQYHAESRYDTLLASCNLSTEAGQRKAARLRGVACTPASSWLGALPVCRAQTLSDVQFRSAARLRLGLPQGPTNAVDVRCDCGDHVKKTDIDHGLTCQKRSGTKTMRHNILQGVWRRIARRAGVATSLEPVLEPLAGGQGNNKKPWSRGDIIWTMEEITIGDVSVIHPAAATYVAGAAKKEGSAAQVRDDQKTRRYKQSDMAGYMFKPLTVESYGRMGKPAMDVLNEFANAAASNGRVDKATFVQNALRELSAALCKGNYLVFKRANDVYAQAYGEVFVEGAAVITDQQE